MKVLSLFCGVGGTCLGFKNAGFDIQLGIDNDPYVIESYNANFNHKGVVEDINNIDLSLLPRVEGIIASPPCQGFSINGKQDPNDDRNKLLFRTAHVIVENNPNWFLIENVPNMNHEKFKNVTEPAFNLLKNNYTLIKLIINAKNFGVPQNRKRLIWLGLKDSNNRNINEIVKLISQNHFQPIKTVKDAIWHLRHDGVGDTKVKPPSVCRWVKLKQGEKDLISRRYRLDWNKTAPTLTAGKLDKRATACWHIHPDHPRPITVEEGLLLSSFPNNWKLPDAQYRKRAAVGNAVPPLMANHIAKCIKNIIQDI